MYTPELLNAKLDNPHWKALRYDVIVLRSTVRAMLPRVVGSLPAISLPAMVPSIDCELS